MIQSLKALLALTGDPGLVPGTHTVDHNSIGSTLGDPMLFIYQPLQAPSTHMAHAYIHTAEHSDM